jgi:hypothetical protein
MDRVLQVIASKKSVRRFGRMDKKKATLLPTKTTEEGPIHSPLADELGHQGARRPQYRIIGKGMVAISPDTSTALRVESGMV